MEFFTIPLLFHFFAKIYYNIFIDIKKRGDKMNSNTYIERAKKTPAYVIEALYNLDKYNFNRLVDITIEENQLELSQMFFKLFQWDKRVIEYFRENTIEKLELSIIALNLDIIEKS